MIDYAITKNLGRISGIDRESATRGLSHVLKIKHPIHVSDIFVYDSFVILAIYIHNQIVAGIRSCIHIYEWKNMGLTRGFIHQIRYLRQSLQGTILKILLKYYLSRLVHSNKLSDIPDPCPETVVGDRIL